MLAPRAQATQLGMRLTALAFSPVRFGCCTRVYASPVPISQCAVLAPAALNQRSSPCPALQAAPIVVAAADDGGVSVYSLAGFYDAAAAAEAAEGVEGSAEHWRQEQRRRLEAALRLHTSQQLSD